MVILMISSRNKYAANLSLYLRWKDESVGFILIFREICEMCCKKNCCLRECARSPEILSCEKEYCPKPRDIELREGILRRENGYNAAENRARHLKMVIITRETRE